MLRAGKSIETDVGHGGWLRMWEMRISGGVAANCWYWVSLGGGCDKNILELYGIMWTQIKSFDKPILKE